jgi:hypothetical protein
LALERQEDVVVSDFHTFLNDIAPWNREDSPYYGLGAQDIYRRLFCKYIKLRPEIVAQVDAFWRERLVARRTLAVHVRSSDKIRESVRLHEVNISYHAKIAEFLERNLCDSIFLLTDSSEVLAEFVSRYGKQLVYTECARTNTEMGIHKQSRASPRQTGIEVIVDAYLASRCACFIGNGHSNVSTSILHMGEWADGDHFLFGENRLMQPHYRLEGPTGHWP